MKDCPLFNHSPIASYYDLSLFFLDYTLEISQQMLIFKRLRRSFQRQPELTLVLLSVCDTPGGNFSFEFRYSLHSKLILQYVFIQILLLDMLLSDLIPLMRPSRPTKKTTILFLILVVLL